MTKSEINSWLNSERDWTNGLRLFMHFSDNYFLKVVFQTNGESEFNKERMIEELKMVLQSTETKIVHIEDPKLQLQKKQAIETRMFSDEEWARLPEVGKQLKYNINKWYSERGFLRAKLPEQESIQERYDLAVKIKQLTRDIKNGFDELKYYKKHGHMPPANDHVDFGHDNMTISQLYKRKDNLITYVSKFKNDTEKTAKVKNWQKEIEVLTRRLSAV